MYNDTIKVANKIISYDDLFEIFSKMQEKLMYYKKIMVYIPLSCFIFNFIFY